MTFFNWNILLKLLNPKYWDSVKNIIFDELDINDNKNFGRRKFLKT